MSLSASIAKFLVRHRGIGFGIALALSALSLLGLKHFEIRNDYRSYFQNGNAYLENADWLSARRGETTEAVILIYEPEDGDAFSMLSLLQYMHIAERAKKLPHTREAKSWLDMDKPIQVASDNKTKDVTYKTAPFDFGIDLFSEKGRQILRNDALKTPTVAGRYVSHDGSTAAVLVFIEISSHSKERMTAIEQLVSEIEGIEAELQEAASRDRIRIAGSTLFDYAAYKVLSKDARSLFPFILLLISSALFILYRSYLFAAAAFIIIVIPIIVTAGVVAALGYYFSTIAVSGLLLVGTLAVADVIHISNSFFLNLSQPISKTQAIEKALAKNLWAITATSSTTALGELAMLFSASPPIQVMGIVVIIGAFVALGLALLMLPLVLTAIPTQEREVVSRVADKLSRLSGICHRNPSRVLIVFLPIILVMTAGILQSRVTDTMSGWFSKGTTFRQGMDALDAGYLGGDTITVAMEMPARDIAAARNYPKLDGRLLVYQNVAQAMAEQSGPGIWMSAVESAKAFDGILSGSHETAFRISKTQDTSGLRNFSTATLANSGLMTPLEFGKIDYSLWYFDSSHNSSFTLLDVTEQIDQAANGTSEGRKVRTGGIGPAFASLSVANYWDILKGSAIAFSIISVVMIFVSGSVILGITSIIPNLVPLVCAYGLWGWFVGELNLASITVFSVAMGIVVDDTIHVIVMYRHYLAEGLPSGRAVEEAIRGSGTGLLTTTIIIAGGFFILSFSGFLLTAHKALLVGISLTVAFLFDLTMMAALLAILSKWMSRKRAPNIKPATEIHSCPIL